MIMRVLFLSILILSFIDSFGQASKKKVEVYFEKLSSSFAFLNVGDSISYDEGCLDGKRDSCFKVKIYLQDEVGSYKMALYDTSNKLRGVFVYKGTKNRFIYMEVPVQDYNGNIIETRKIKYYKPKLKSVVKGDAAF